MVLWPDSCNVNYIFAVIRNKYGQLILIKTFDNKVKLIDKIKALHII